MLRVALHAFILLTFVTPLAWAGSIALTLSDNSGPYAEFSKALDEALAGTTWKITASGKSDGTESSAARPDLMVTAGSEAFRLTLARGGTTPVLATLLPRQSYERILSDAGRVKARVSAIYLDQPPARQAAFLRQLLPTQKRIGMLVSNETRSQISLYRQIFANAGLTLDSEDSDAENTLLPAANALLPRVGVLLAIPDSTIYRRENIKALLITSYRHQRPVVAFSAAFVNAGALAALFTTPAQIARQAADLIVSSGTSLPGPTAPGLFAVAINQNVVQALGLSVPDEATIRRSMLADREAR
jgi:putative ABC transport system substrate-binding protein